jgi:transcriptional regulator with XRE-family HTH domain
MHQLGKRLRELREGMGWNQVQLGVYAGISTATVSLAESGQRTPNAETIVKLARALEVDPGALFAESKPPKAEAPSPPTPAEEPVSDEERRLSDIDASQRLLEWLNTEPRERLQKARRALERMDEAIQRTVEYDAATLEYVEQVAELSTSIGEALYGPFGLMADFDTLSKDDAELHETTQSRFWELQATVDAAWKPAIAKRFGEVNARKLADDIARDAKERQHTNRKQRLHAAACKRGVRVAHLGKDAQKARGA